MSDLSNKDFALYLKNNGELQKEHIKELDKPSCRLTIKDSDNNTIVDNIQYANVNYSQNMWAMKGPVVFGELEVECLMTLEQTEILEQLIFNNPQSYNIEINGAYDAMATDCRLQVYNTQTMNYNEAICTANMSWVVKKMEFK